MTSTSSGVRSRTARPHRIDWHATIGSTMTEASRLAAAGCDFGHRGRRRRTNRRTRPLRTRVAFRTRLRPVRLHHSATSVSRRIHCRWSPSPWACRQRSDPEGHRSGLRSALAQRRADSVQEMRRILTATGRRQAIIAGIGINVNHSSFPSRTERIATSLRIASGRVQSRERLLVELLASVDTYCVAARKRGPGTDP